MWPTAMELYAGPKIKLSLFKCCNGIIIEYLIGDSSFFKGKLLWLMSIRLPKSDLVMEQMVL